MGTRDQGYQFRFCIQSHRWDQGLSPDVDNCQISMASKNIPTEEYYINKMDSIRAEMISVYTYELYLFYHENGCNDYDEIWYI